MRHFILRNMLSLCNEDITQSMAARLAERHANVIDALERIIPAILRGFTDKLKEDPDIASNLLHLAGEVNTYQQLMNGIGDESTMQRGHEILQQLFGIYYIDGMAKQISLHTMVRNSSAVKLMQWAAPLCFGNIGKVVAEEKYDATKMGAWLSEESFEIAGEGIARPKGYYYNALNTGSRKTATTKQKKYKDLSWLHFLVLVLCGGLLFWVLRA
jgi:hypothetical protein